MLVKNGSCHQTSWSTHFLEQYTASSAECCQHMIKRPCHICLILQSLIRGNAHPKLKQLRKMSARLLVHSSALTLISVNMVVLRIYPCPPRQSNHCPWASTFQKQRRLVYHNRLATSNSPTRLWAGLSTFRAFCVAHILFNSVYEIC